MEKDMRIASDWRMDFEEYKYRFLPKSMEQAFDDGFRHGFETAIAVLINNTGYQDILGGKRYSREALKED